MVREVEKQLGPVDILVNNAGITRDGTFHKMSAQQWQEVINTNLNSVFNVTRPVIEGMRERKWGRIIQISSINGQKGQYGQANYAAAKAGMHGFTISLARSEEHTPELQSLMRISYAVFCLTKKNINEQTTKPQPITH